MPPAVLAMKTASDGAVHQDAEVELALDVETFFDQQALDDAAAGAGLRRDQLHAQHLAGEVRGFVGGMRELHAAGFAAAAGVDLRLDDHDGRAESLRGLARFFLGEGDFAARRGHAEARRSLSPDTREFSSRSVFRVAAKSGQPVLEFAASAKH